MFPKIKQTSQVTQNRLTFLQTGRLQCFKLLNLVVLIESQCYALHNFILWEAFVFMSYLFVVVDIVLICLSLTDP